MWTNSLLKQNAWKSLKPNYWTAFGISIMYIIMLYLPNIIARGAVSVSINVSIKDIERWIELVEEFSQMSELEIEKHLPQILDAFMPIYRWIATVAVISWAIVIVVTIFITNLTECGMCSFYCKSRQGEVDIGRFFHYFTSGHYVPVMKVMFFRWLYTFLWALALVIPAFVKRYEYLLIPYLLAENPNLPKERAFAISRQTMNGEKWKCFILEVSFIGWWILGALCFMVGMVFVMPYYRATMAEFYTCMRAKMLAMGFTTEEELNPESISNGMPTDMGNMAM